MNTHEQSSNTAIITGFSKYLKSSRRPYGGGKAIPMYAYNYILDAQKRYEVLHAIMNSNQRMTNDNGNALIELGFERVYGENYNCNSGNKLYYYVWRKKEEDK